MEVPSNRASHALSSLRNSDWNSVEPADCCVGTFRMDSTLALRSRAAAAEEGASTEAPPIAIAASHFDATVGIHPSAAEEFVTMREPTR